MRISHLTLLLAGLAAPLSAAEESPKSEKETVAEVVDSLLRGELPAVEEKECQAYTCAEGCTEECQAKTAKYTAWMKAEPVAYYGEMFAQKPASWEALAPVIIERYTAEATTTEQRGTLVELASFAPYERSAKLGAKLWKLDSAPFQMEHVLSFASRGGEVFADVLREKVEKTNGKEGCCDVRPAAFLAMHGDGAGKATLLRTVQDSVLDENTVCNVMIAAMGLEKLGKEGLVEKTQRRVHEAALAALDAGELERARSIALQAKFFHEVLSSSKAKGPKGKSKYGVDLARIQKKARMFCEEEAAAVATADDVFRVVESVTPM